MDKRIETLLQQCSFTRTRDLVEAGLDRREISRAVMAGSLVKAVISGETEQGVFSTPGADEDPDHNEALAMFLFGGRATFAMQYAAMRHGLTTSTSETMQVLVPYSTLLGQRTYLKATRTRREEALTVGVDEYGTALGVAIRITSPARTVVDLLRMKDRNAEDWRHGIDALKTYIETGQDPGELLEIAASFDKRLPDIVQTAVDTFASGGYTP